MSHFTTNSRANIVDKAAFIAAMRELGFTDIKENATLKGYNGNTMRVDVAAHIGDYGIGIVKNKEGKYDMVADWWGIRTNARPKEFDKALGRNIIDEDVQDCVLRYTTKHTIVSKYKKLGYSCQSVADEKGNIQVTMSKF